MTADEPQKPLVTPQPPAADKADQDQDVVAEVGGPQGPEPTRFGDWERAGRCSDF